MPRVDYKRCRHCGRSSSEVGPLSYTRKCSDCARERLLANIDGLHDHERPVLDRWRRAVAAGVVPSEWMAAMDAAGVFGVLDDRSDVA